jgi:hypothetical protein
VSIHDGSAIAVVGTDGAVVWSLGARETGRGPSEGLDCEFVLDFQQTVFLLNAIPSLFVLHGIKYLFCEVSEVGVCRLLVGEFLVGPDPGVAHDDDVVLLSEWVSAVENWSQDDL